MRGNKMIGILWLIIAACLIAVLVLKMKDSEAFNVIHINGKKIEFDGSPASLADSYTFSKNEINSVDINLVSETLNVQKSEDDKIHVELYTPKDYMPTVQILNNVLKIDSITKAKISIALNRRVVVKLPEGIELSDFDADLTSGSIHIDDCSVNNLDVNSTSGSVNLTHCDSLTADVKSTSGSVHVTDCEIGILEAKSTSGSVRVDGSFNKVDLHSISGSVHADFRDALTEDSELQSTSGSVHLNVPSNAAFTAKYSTASGTYRNSITGTSGKKGNDVVNGGGIKVELHTTSGSVHVN